MPDQGQGEKSRDVSPLPCMPIEHSSPSPAEPGTGTVQCDSRGQPGRGSAQESTARTGQGQQGSVSSISRSEGCKELLCHPGGTEPPPGVPACPARPQLPVLGWTEMWQWQQCRAQPPSSTGLPRWCAAPCPFGVMERLRSPPSLSLLSAQAVSMATLHPGPLHPLWQTHCQLFWPSVHLPLPLHRSGQPSGRTNGQGEPRALPPLAQAVLLCRQKGSAWPWPWQEHSVKEGDTGEMGI